MSLRSWWLRVRPVLSEAEYVGWLFLSFLAPASLILWLQPDAATGARAAGLFWELLGISVVAIGLRDTRRKFGRAPISTELAGWMGKFAQTFSAPPAQSLELPFLASTSALHPPTISQDAAPSSTTDVRLAALESAFREFRAHLGRTEQQLSENLRKLESTLEEERSQRTQALRRLDRAIEDVAVGGLALEGVGLIWLVLGLVSSTFSDCIAK